MNVLSLFDGMSCGQIALDKLGIKVDNYFAAEIDKYAIQVTQKNYPNTIQIGDVTDVYYKEHGQLVWGKPQTDEQPRGYQDVDIDILYGGSPCQSFSRAGDGSGFDGKSALFFEFVRILKEVKPKYFLLENVIMKKEWEDVITEILGVEPIEIVSSKLVPQKRRRLYWTNIPNIEQPEQVDYDINDYFDGPGFPSACNVKRMFKKKEVFNTITATYWKGIRGSGRPAVSTEEGFLDDNRSAHRMLTPNECERLQTVPLDYTDCVSKTQRFKMLGNGWTVDVIAHIFKNLECSRIASKQGLAGAVEEASKHIIEPRCVRDGIVKRNENK